MKIISKIFMLTNIIILNVVGLLIIGVTPLPHTIVVPISTITISGISLTMMGIEIGLEHLRKKKVPPY